MIYTSKSAPDLTDDEVKKCISLSMRGYGSMSDELRWYRNKQKRLSKVTMVHSDGQLIAWSLQFRNELKAPNNQWHLHIYVRRNKRRHGVGRSLLSRALMGKQQPILVYPHSDESNILYAAALDRGRAIDNRN